MNGVENFDYTGNVVCAYLQKAGHYKLEVWGGEGGIGAGPDSYSTSKTDWGGYGGYSYGTIFSNASSSIYIVVGQWGYAPQAYCTNSSYCNISSSYGTTGHSSYNGGGGGDSCVGGGGGATHIATVPGVLSSLSSSANQAKVLIVAGGGGGGAVNATSQNGGNGGGYIGAKGYGLSPTAYTPNTANQTSGYSFGLGGSVSSNSCANAGAGGGGWYGGYSGTAQTEQPGGGGSGYIANTLLLQDKGMYQYSYFRGTSNSSCTSSTAATTKTTCTTNVSSSAVSNYAKQGNGYARITYLGT